MQAYRNIIRSNDILLLTLLFVAAIIIVNPAGDFPLYDDWSFASALKRFLATGNYQPSGWAFMTVITNIIWAYPFCVIAGFSFNTLRASTLVLSWLGVCGTYVLVRELPQPRWIAVLVSLILMFNPIYFLLSFTFMKDASFTAILVLSALFFSRHLRTNSTHSLALGAALGVAATLSRQVGLCVPVAFAICLIATNKISRSIISRAVIPPALSVAALLLFQHWLAAPDQPATLYGSKEGEIIQTLTSGVALIPVVVIHVSIFLTYYGLFLLPLLLLLPLGKH